jgi:single-strand DNA-binding protein
MNQVALIGRLVRNPEVRETAGGTAVCNFTLAIDDGWGENKKTNYIPVLTFGKTAENCGKFLAKGKQCGVTGKIQTGSYEKKDGTKVYTTDVVADRVEFIDFGEKVATKAAESHTEHIPSGFSELNEEIPF